MGDLKEEEENKIPKKIDSLLLKDKAFSIIDNIKKGDKYYEGRIEINYLNENLSFDISIPHNYPLTHPNSDNISIIFKNKDYIGINHVNLDGSVCFHPDKNEDFDEKLLYELECLKQWIKDYYVLKKEDDNYTYLMHTTEIGCVNKLYFTNTKNNFSKNSFGTFNFSIYSDEKFGKKKFPIKKLFRLGFNNGKIDTWSDTFTKELEDKTCRKGLYYFIEEEPLRKTILVCIG